VEACTGKRAAGFAGSDENDPPENDPPGEAGREIHWRAQPASPPPLEILPSLKGENSYRSHGSSLTFCLTLLPRFSWLPLADFDIFLMDKSSTNGTPWFLLRSIDDLCAKSFLMSAILLYNFEHLTLAYFQ